MYFYCFYLNVLLLFVPLPHNSTQTSDKGRKADQQQVEEMVEEGEKEGKKGADILTHFPSNDKNLQNLILKA